MNTLKNRLEEVMKEYNLKTQQDLANFAEVSKGLVNQWFKGETGLGVKPLIAFEKKTHFSTQWLADGKGKKYRDTNINATGVKFGDSATIGDSNNFSIIQNSGSLKNKESHSQISDNAFCQPLPHIPEGSEIWIDENQTDIVDGKIYLVECGGKRYYRRVFSQPETQEILLNTDNPLFPNKKMPMDKVKIIGRVTAWKVNEQ